MEYSQELQTSILVFTKHNLPFRRMISGSKSLYRKTYPENLIIFNARIYDEKTFNLYKNSKIKNFFDGQKIEIWYGDLDLNFDMQRLQAVAYELKKCLIITTETGEPYVKIYNPEWNK